MPDIYERKIQDSFAGQGTESIVVEDGLIVGHTRGWNDPSVQDSFKPSLVGQPVQKLSLIHI